MATATAVLQILEASDYDTVRAWIDISVDANALPDSTIDLYGPLAESDVLSRDAYALDYSESGTAPDAVKWTRVRRAAVFLTAALLCGALPAITSEQVGGDRYARTAFDAEKRAAVLRGLASTELAGYLNPDGLAETLFAFGVARGYRGR